MPCWPSGPSLATAIAKRLARATTALALPVVLAPPAVVQLNRYVVDKSLDGLFYVPGEQEKQIRTSPAARVTDLLKQVFAK